MQVDFRSQPVARRKYKRGQLNAAHDVAPPIEGT